MSFFMTLGKSKHKVQTETLVGNMNWFLNEMLQMLFEWDSFRKEFKTNQLAMLSYGHIIDPWAARLSHSSYPYNEAT